MRELAPSHEQRWFDIYGRVAMSGEAVRFESLANALGQRWFEVHAFRIGEPDANQVAILFNDITDRRRNSAALEQLNTSLEREVSQRTQERDRVWQVGQDMLGVATAEGVWESVNPAWKRILGWTESEIVGRTSEWLEHPDDSARTTASPAGCRSDRAAGEVYRHGGRG